MWISTVAWVLPPSRWRLSCLSSGFLPPPTRSAETSCWFFLVLLIAYDLWSKGKLHRATIFGGLAMVLVEPLGMTPAWHALAAWAQALCHP